MWGGQDCVSVEQCPGGLDVRKWGQVLEEVDDLEYRV